MKPWRAKRRKRLRTRHRILLVASPEDDSSYTESVDWAAWSEEASQASKEGRAVDRCTTSNNAADDYAHRGRKLSAMPYYVYRMYVTRVAKPCGKTCAPHTIFFEEHYALAKTYAQQVMLRVKAVMLVSFPQRRLHPRALRDLPPRAAATLLSSPSARLRCAARTRSSGLGHSDTAKSWFSQRGPTAVATPLRRDSCSQTPRPSRS